MKRFGGNVACGVVLATAWGAWCYDIDLCDGGFLARGTERIMHGEISHHDLFSRQPLGSFCVAEALFKSFGTPLIVPRAFGVCIHVVIILLAYLLAQQLTGRAMATAAANQHRRRTVGLDPSLATSNSADDQFAPEDQHDTQ